MICLCFGSNVLPTVFLFFVAVTLTVRIMVSYEKHYDEGAMQRSLYIKITLFRWMNTAIITRWITPFVATLGVDKIDVSDELFHAYLLFITPTYRLRWKHDEIAPR